MFLNLIISVKWRLKYTATPGMNHWKKKFSLISSDTNKKKPAIYSYLTKYCGLCRNYDKPSRDLLKCKNVCENKNVI